MADKSAAAVTKPANEWASPRTYIALGMLGLFAFSLFLPYFQTVPEGQAGNLIIGNAKVVETLAVLVLGYYFGTTQGSTQKTDAVTAMVAQQGTGSGGTTNVTVEPPSNVTINTPAQEAPVKVDEELPLDAEALKAIIADPATPEPRRELAKAKLALMDDGELPADEQIG